jgi:hypothetical protein
MGVRRSVKVSAGYCSDSDVMVTAVLWQHQHCLKAVPVQPLGTPDVPVWGLGVTLSLTVCGAAIPSASRSCRVSV